MNDAHFIKKWIDCGTLMSSENDHVLLGWGERKWHEAPSGNQTPSFYFPDFFLKENKPWFIHECVRELSIKELIAMIREVLPSKSDPIQWNNPYLPLFKSTFNELKNKFRQREVDKAVPFVYEIASEKMKKDRLFFSLYTILNYSLTNPVHLYGFWDSNQGILGATPEILFKLNTPVKLETVACAGTISDQRDVSAILKDPKELHEHQLVVDGIKESLALFGVVRIEEIRLLKLSRLVHLVTPLSVHLYSKLFTFEEIVRTLHPTPAVGTFPRETFPRDQEKGWLFKYQRWIDRSRFGAPCGFVFSDLARACCYVSIRNMQWAQDQIKIGAGCGLVIESECEREWAEINLKLQAIKEMLAL